MSLRFDKIEILPPSRNNIIQTFNTLQRLKKDHLQPISFPQIRQGQQTKGLKFISGQLKKLLMKNKRLGYHQISRILVENFGGHYQQEKNIKRRVYDAINVLLAIGVIIKNEQNISINYSNLMHTKLLVKEEQCNTDQKIRIEEKYKKLKKFKTIYRNLEMLTQRNKQIKKTQKENRIIMQSKQVIQNSKAFEKISFPGFFAKLQDGAQVKLTNDRRTVEVKSQQEIQYFSFEDALDKLEFAKQEQQGGYPEKQLKKSKNTVKTNKNKK